VGVTVKDDPVVINLIAHQSDVSRSLKVEHDVDFRAGGTGKHYQEALGRAIGEVVERYGMAYSQLSELNGSFNQLQDNHNMFSPESIHLFSDQQYEGESFPYEELTKDTEVKWVRGYNILSEQNIFFPAQLVYGAYSHADGEKNISYSTTSGCAAGKTFKEAVFGGILEQIERDAMMLTWLTKQSAPKLSLEDSSISSLFRERFQSQAINYTLLDISWDFSVPVTLALAEDTSNREYGGNVGLAAEPTREESIYKSLLEISQGRVYGKRSKLNFEKESFSKNQMTGFDRNLQYYLKEENWKKIDSLVGTEKKQPDNREVTLSEVLSELDDEGFDVLAFNMTPPDIKKQGYAVVKTIIPQLVQLSVPAYPFKGHPRLYNLPKKCGYVDEALSPDDINSDPHPLP
jgi:ribosomal protein S12 methylthiotransferase accessory factor